MFKIFFFHFSYSLCYSFPGIATMTRKLMLIIHFKMLFSNLPKSKGPSINDVTCNVPSKVLGEHWSRAWGRRVSHICEEGVFKNCDVTFYMWKEISTPELNDLHRSSRKTLQATMPPSTRELMLGTPPGMVSSEWGHLDI